MTKIKSLSATIVALALALGVVGLAGCVAYPVGYYGAAPGPVVVAPPVVVGGYWGGGGGWHHGGGGYWR